MFASNPSPQPPPKYNPLYAEVIFEKDLQKFNKRCQEFLDNGWKAEGQLIVTSKGYIRSFVRQKVLQ